MCSPAMRLPNRILLAFQPLIAFDTYRNDWAQCDEVNIVVDGLDSLWIFPNNNLHVVMVEHMSLCFLIMRAHLLFACYPSFPLIVLAMHDSKNSCIADGSFSRPLAVCQYSDSWNCLGWMVANQCHIAPNSTGPYLGNDHDPVPLGSWN